jgi:NADH-quinone oxidoreductase subunit M
MTTVLILLPMAAALIIWLLPLNHVSAGSLALLAALAEIGVWIQMLACFDFDQGGLQFSQSWTWFGDLGVSYHVGVYGFSVWLIGMTSVVLAASIAYAFWAGRERSRAYMGLMLFLTGAIVGVFAAQDLLLFYAFFEAMLIPLYVLVGVWGGPGRMAATLKFVIYTMAGSLLMLAAVIAYGLSEGTFDLVKIGASSNEWIFLGFIAAFAIKAPLFPLHGWLPDAYRESSPEVSAVLSGVVSKAAAYGFLRIAVAKFPEPAQDFRVPILVLAAVGLVYGSLLAFRAPDLRGVIAYSSLAQMGLITMGVFAVNDLGLDGSVLQMVNHGLISATLFLLAGMIERRALTGELGRLGGMARGRPALATVLMTIGVIALAVPGSAAFAGEFAILAGVFSQGWFYAVVGAVAILLAAAYVLRLISAVLHRAPGTAVTESALDLRPAELAIVVPLIGLLLLLSAWPAAITDRVTG